MVGDDIRDGSLGQIILAFLGQGKAPGFYYKCIRRTLDGFYLVKVFSLCL